MRVRTHSNPLSYNERYSSLDLGSLFKDVDRPLDFEVGFGRGTFIRHYAQSHPNRNIVGIEVRKLMCEILTERLAKLDLENVHLVHGNGTIFLEDAFVDHSLDRIFVFHPDPWFKKRHHNRRVVNSEFITHAFQKLKPTGALYLSTDVEELWDEFNELVARDLSVEIIKDYSFWESDFKTHWDSFSENDGRQSFKLVLAKNQS